jgi:hypothetical protein
MHRKWVNGYRGAGERRSMWSTIETFLSSRGYDEAAITEIVEIARQENLDPALIDRVLASSEREEVGSVH